MSKSIERRAIEWALGNDTGISSMAICGYMLGIEGVRTTPPADAADRARCIRLLKLIPEWLPRLHQMAGAIPPERVNVYSAGGFSIKEYGWSTQVPLIMEEGGFKL